MPETPLGMGRGSIYPASAARHLLNPLRNLIQPASRIVRRMGLNSTDHVLELGCGPGWFSRQIAESIPQGELVLCDIQGDMLEIAKKRTEPLVNVRTQVSNGESLPFDKATFDVVLLSSVLGEIPEKRVCVSEIRRVLKGGGSLVVVETRRDSDFIRFDDLVALAESSGFSLDRRWGPRWEYTARFVAAD